METIYLICDYSDKKAEMIQGCPNTGVEYLGKCRGRIVKDNGDLIGRHSSSTLDFLRADLLAKLDDPSKYEIIDLIGKDIPEVMKEHDFEEFKKMTPRQLQDKDLYCSHCGARPDLEIEDLLTRMKDCMNCNIDLAGGGRSWRKTAPTILNELVKKYGNREVQLYLQKVKFQEM